MDLTDSPSTPKKSKQAGPKSPQATGQADSRALPLLTPASDSQPPRSPLPNSPIPFKGAGASAVAQAAHAGAAAAVQDAGAGTGAAPMEVDAAKGVDRLETSSTSAAAAAAAAPANAQAAPGAAAEAAAGPSGSGSQAAPANRWIAQADCRGMGLQGGDASHMLPRLKGPEGCGWQIGGEGGKVWMNPDVPAAPAGDGRVYWRQLVSGPGPQCTGSLGV